MTNIELGGQRIQGNWFISAPVYPFVKNKIGKTQLGEKIFTVVEILLMVVLLITSVIFLTGSDYNPFIYFRS